MQVAPATATAPVTSSLPPTNKTAINLKLKFVSLSTGNAQTVGAGWLSTSGDTSILSEQQFEFANKAMRGVANSRTESEITAFSGQSAEIGAEQPVSVDGTNANAGVTLYVRPEFLHDAAMFTLDVAAALDPVTGDPSQPGTQALQASNHVTLFPGQTVALKVDMPANGWIPDSEDARDDAREFLAFVTPTIVDVNQKAAPAATDTTDAKEALLAR
jgi:hypothetical protein